MGAAFLMAAILPNLRPFISVDLGTLSTRALGQVATNSGGWTQLGSDIDGEAAGDISGIVSASADGKTVAIGAPYNDGNGADSGHVRLFTWDGTAWVQKGADIDGENAGDIASIVSLSADGNTVVIGAHLNDGAGEDAGHARIYDWDGTSWTQRGADIDGEAAGDQSGLMVSISADGNTVSVGAAYNGGVPNTNANGYWAGHARIFDWNGSAWSQRGDDIDGEAAVGFFGRRTRLSADGNTIAVAGFLNDGNGLDSGHVRMYDWNGASWTQRGRDIDGSRAGDQSAHSISLSADGNTVAVGSLLNDSGGQDAGQMRIFDWNSVAWQQRGDDIYGEAVGDISTRGLSLSADGNTVAIGAPYNDGNGDDAGHVRLYDWNGTAWLPRGVDIDGESAGVGGLVEWQWQYRRHWRRFRRRQWHRFWADAGLSMVRYRGVDRLCGAYSNYQFCECDAGSFEPRSRCQRDQYTQSHVWGCGQSPRVRCRKSIQHYYEHQSGAQPCDGRQLCQRGDRACAHPNYPASGHRNARAGQCTSQASPHITRGCSRFLMPACARYTRPSP